MKLLIESYGTLSDESKQIIALEANNQATFNYLDEVIVINIDEVADDHLVISTSHKFSVLADGVCNLNEVYSTFDISYFDEKNIALPIYDASYNLKFSVIKEQD